MAFGHAADQSTAPTCLVGSFGPRELLAVEYEGRPVMLAGQLAAALEYVDTKQLSQNISTKWKDDFVEGVDYVKLTGDKLSSFKAELSNWLSNRQPVADPRQPVVDPRAASLILLTESGAQLAAMLSRTSVGRMFRRWLVDELLPQWRRMMEARTVPVPVPATAPAPALPPPAPVDTATLREMRRLSELLYRHGSDAEALAVARRAAVLVGASPEAVPEPTDDWRAFVARWWTVHRSSEIPSAALVPLAAGLLGDGTQRSQETRLGHELRRLCGRVIDGLRVEVRQGRHGSLYRLVSGNDATRSGHPRPDGS